MINPESPKPVVSTREDLKIALDLFKQSGDSMNTMWTAFSTVSLGLIAYLFNGKVEMSSKTLLAIAYLVFAVGNLVSITRLRNIRAAAAEFARNFNVTSETEVNPDFEQMLSTLHVAPLRAMQAFHIALAVSVVLSILFKDEILIFQLK